MPQLKTKNIMNQEYVKSLELWIETQKVQIEQNKESLSANIKQIELISKENGLLSERIAHDSDWVKISEKELEDYKKEYA